MLPSPYPPLQYELLDALYVLLRQMPRFRRSSAHTPTAATSASTASVPPNGASSGAKTTGREFDNMAEYLHYRGQWLGHCRGLPQQCRELFQGCAAVNPKTEAGG